MFSLPVLEISRFRRSLLTRLALVIIVLIPTFYGGVYLVANWNPTGNIDQLTAAIVDEDQPAEVAGSDGAAPTELAAGNELTDQLTGSDDAGFTWVTATEDEAQSGLDDGRYDAVLRIPDTFSASLASLGEADPRNTSLTLTTNDARNYINGNIASSILANIRTNLAETTISSYLDSVYIGFNTIHDSISGAATGATRLADGATSLSAGAGSLTDGIGDLNAGAGSLAAGAADAATGATTVANGAASLSTGASTLADGAASAADGAATLAAGAGRVAGGTGALAQSADAVTARITDIQSGIDTSLGGIDATGIATRITGSRDAAATALTDQVAALQARYPNDPDVAVLAQSLASIEATLTPAADVAGRVDTARTALTGRADAIAAAATTVDSQINALDDGAQQVATGASDLADGTAQVATGARALATAAGTLAGGAQDLATGTGTLAGGAQDLATGTGTALTGAQRLQAGAADLDTGAGTLADGLTSGVASIPTYSDADRANRTDVVSEPVTATAVRENKVASYGEGLAHYFIPLALWIGGMITYQILKAAPFRAFASRAPSWRIALAGYFPGVLFGILQAALLSAVLLLFVGLDTPTPVAFTAFLGLVAIAFASVHQALVAFFGGTGRLIGLVFLVLQLASAGGTYPIETSPSFFQAISPFMPLTHAVAGVRALIAGGNAAPVAGGVVTMFLTIAVALAVTTLAAHRSRLWSMTRLHPSLSI